MFVADTASGMSTPEVTPCDATADFSTLAASGITVHAFDAHGHGQSEPSAQKDRAFVKRFSNYVRHSQRIHSTLLTELAQRELRTLCQRFMTASSMLCNRWMIWTPL